MQGPERCLRHLECLSARGLDIKPGSGCYYTIHILGARSSSNSNDHGLVLVYRSELVTDTANPDWRPIDFSSLTCRNLPALKSSTLLIAVHTVDQNQLEETPDASSTTTASSLLSSLHQPLYPDINDEATRQLAEALKSASTTGTSTSVDGSNGIKHSDEQREEQEDEEKADVDGGSIETKTTATTNQQKPATSPPPPTLSPAAITYLSTPTPLLLPGSLLFYKLINLNTIQPLLPSTSIKTLAILGDTISINTVVLEFEDGMVWVDPSPPILTTLQQQLLLLDTNTSTAVSSSDKLLSTTTTTEAAVVVGGGTSGKQGQVLLQRPASTPVTPQGSPKKQQQLKEAVAALTAPPILPLSVDGNNDNNNSITAKPTTAAAAAIAANGVSNEPRRRFGFMSRLLGGGADTPASSSTTATDQNGNGKTTTTTGGDGHNTNADDQEQNQTRILTVDTLRTQIATLISLRQQIQEAQEAAKKARENTASLLTQQQPVVRLQHGIQTTTAAAAEYARQAQVVASRLAAVQKKVEEVNRIAAVRGQALATTLKVLQGTEKRLHDAEVSLHGSQGTGHLKQILVALTARRCYLVAKLGAAYGLGPISVSVPQAPPGGYLEERLDVGWAGAAQSSGGHRSIPSYGPSTWRGALNSSLYKQEMRLAVGGLELHPSVWRKAIEADGYDWDTQEDKDAGIALGHLAHIVLYMSRYLEVLLRYPIRYRGSTSSILDEELPAGSWTVPVAADVNTNSLNSSTATTATTTTSSTGWFGRSTTTTTTTAATSSSIPTSSSSSKPAHIQHQQTVPHTPKPPPVEYPLYCPNNRERPRFAVGVFLLNKNVSQLLQAHGIAAAGPNSLLHNVYKLMVAAESAFEQPLHQCRR